MDPGWVGRRVNPSAGGMLAAALAGFTVPAAPEQIRAVLAELVDAATARYLLYGHGNGVMLVHSATAPSPRRALSCNSRLAGNPARRQHGRSSRGRSSTATRT